MAVIFFSWVILSCVLAEAATHFKDLSHILNVSYALENPVSDGVVKAGVSSIRVEWVPTNASVNATSIKTVSLKLCFGASSQVERGWRKSNDLLSKDKACAFDIASQPYSASGNSTVWTVSKSVPFAQYFVRAYGVDASGEKVAYGQTTNAKLNSTLFTVEPITGRHPSIDIAAGVFSAFSVLSLVGFFAVEKKLAKTNKA